MRYLLDTNHWSYLQEGLPTLVARIRSLPAHALLLMPVVSQAELLGGVALVSDSKRREELLTLYHQSVSSATEILPITSGIAEEFADIYACLRRKGNRIETNDMWIAATARAHGLIVVSNDDHFNLVDRMRWENWSK